MNFEYLRNFVKLIEYKSFSDLANDIPITQSTLSHQISQLEKELGLILIKRSTKKFEITEAGKVFLKYAREILQLYDQSNQELLKFRDQGYETIIISASTIPGSHILPKYIAEFRTNNPNIDFKVLVNNSQKSIENLNKKLADFAGIGSFLNYNKDNFEIIQLGEDQFKFICAPNHRLIKNDNIKIKLEDLQQYPFIWREQGSGMRDTFSRQFPEYKKLNIKLEINDNDSIISTVSESNYISIMSELMAKKAEDAGLIRMLEVINRPVIVKRPLFFIRRKEASISDIKAKFWSYILQESKKK